MTQIKNFSICFSSKSWTCVGYYLNLLIVVIFVFSSGVTSGMHKADTAKKDVENNKTSDKKDEQNNKEDDDQFSMDIQTGRDDLN